MINKTFYSIFQQGSRTYFYSSLFFPTHVKQDVFQFYGFVRKADNFVDSIPQDHHGFQKFKTNYYQAREGHPSGDIVIDSFVQLADKKDIDDAWVDAFLSAMEQDLTKRTYKTIHDTIAYMYGSAEVIGLMMAKIMSLPKESYPFSRYLGRAMQYINFVRDIAEDEKLGRIYFPGQEMRHQGLSTLSYEEARDNPMGFTSFIRQQIDRYYRWQEIAEKGYKYIPKRYLISVKTAADMYQWTAEQIYKNPFIIYEWKVKPLVTTILTTMVKNIIDPKKAKNYPQYPYQEKQLYKTA
jgi:15-cis-phytoene synthase